MAKRTDRSARRRAAWERSENERTRIANAAAPTAKPSVVFEDKSCVVTWVFPDGSTSTEVFRRRAGYWVRKTERLVPSMVRKTTLERTGVSCRISTAPGGKRSTSQTHLTGGVRGSVMVAEFPASNPSDDPGKFDKVFERSEYSESEFAATLALLQRLAMI